MLRICNTPKISRKRYTFKTSNLHHRVLRVILHLVHLPLHQQTVVYIRNWQVQKIHFLLLLVLGNLPSDGLTQERVNFLLHFFLYQCVPFITRQVSKLLLSPKFQELSSKATK